MSCGEVAPPFRSKVWLMFKFNPFNSCAFIRKIHVIQRLLCLLLVFPQSQKSFLIEGKILQTTNIHSSAQNVRTVPTNPTGKL